MKKSLIICVAVFGLLAFNSGPLDTNTQQAWYETGIERPIDGNITSATPGKFYFEFHTDLQPKIVNSDHFYTVNKNPKAYFTAYLINTTDSTVVVSRQDGSVMMIQEAKDSAGNWIPIEHWQHSGCGNSYFDPLRIESNHYVLVPIKKYEGDFKTEMRLKLSFQKRIFYSDPFQGSVNKSQFKTTADTAFNWNVSYLNELWH